MKRSSGSAILILLLGLLAPQKLWPGSIPSPPPWNTKAQFKGRFKGVIFNDSKRQAINGFFSGSRGDDQNLKTLRLNFRTVGGSRTIEENVIGDYPIWIKVATDGSAYSLTRTIQVYRRSIRFYGDVTGTIRLRRPIDRTAEGKQRLDGPGSFTIFDNPLI